MNRAVERTHPLVFVANCLVCSDMMFTTMYFTVVIAATSRRTSLRLWTNTAYEIQGPCCLPTIEVAPKQRPLSGHGKLLPQRPRANVTRAGIRGGFQIPISSKKDPISENLSSRLNTSNRPIVQSSVVVEAIQRPKLNASGRHLKRESFGHYFHPFALTAHMIDPVQIALI